MDEHLWRAWYGVSGASATFVVSFSVLAWRKWRGLPQHPPYWLLATGFGGGLFCIGLLAAGARWTLVLVAAIAVRRLSCSDGLSAAVIGALGAATASYGRVDAYTAATAVLASAVLASCLSDLSEALRGQVGGLLYVMSVSGVFLTTPDTEHVLVLAGASAAAMFTNGLCRAPQLEGTSAGLAAAALTWVIMMDGAARTTSIVGGFACVGVLCIAPVVRRWSGSAPGTRIGAGRLTFLVALHLVIALVAARVVGMLFSVNAALVASTVLLATSSLLLWLSATLVRKRQD